MCHLPVSERFPAQLGFASSPAVYGDDLILPGKIFNLVSHGPDIPAVAMQDDKRISLAINFVVEFHPV